jgi:hypothetical protein
MTHEKNPREQGARASETGPIPDRRPDFIWAGPGAGATCSICGATAGPDDVEFELEFTSEIEAGSQTYHVHASCFTAWREGRSARSRLPKDMTDGRMPTRGGSRANKAGPA